ncbi:MAG: HIT domain-containing protein [Alphaproteobacteria bacterium]|nr:HIT domain-containing protein [Alphaproteobacteria bacterium]
MSYDSSNIFAKILRGEIPCDKVYEDEFALAFNDISPQAPKHILVIPKGPYASYDDFIASADDAEIVGFQRAIAKVIGEADIIAGGYRLLSNTGVDAHQAVPHYHVHILAGANLGGKLVA